MALVDFVYLSNLVQISEKQWLISRLDSPNYTNFSSLFSMSLVGQRH